MKTVSGEVVSFKSISLKKAAKTLSNFASSDNGASPALCAYLKRAVASFNELVQLHREAKSSGSEPKVKKQRSTDIASEGTVRAVINGGDKGLVKEGRCVNKREGEAGRIDVRTEVQKVEEIVDGDVVDVGGGGKKSKKKRIGNETATFKNEPSDDFDAIDMKGLKNATESSSRSKDIKKKKKDKTEMKAQSLPRSENSNDGQAIEIGERRSYKQQKHKKDHNQSYGDHAPMNAIEVKNEIESFDGSIEMKKKKKKNKNKVDIKEERVNSGINGDEQSNKVHGNVENADKDKRTHVVKERKNEGKLEIEANNNNKSRKRKHEILTAKELDGSQEQHKSKKKR